MISSFHRNRASRVRRSVLRISCQITNQHGVTRFSSTTHLVVHISEQRTNHTAPAGRASEINWEGLEATAKRSLKQGIAQKITEACLGETVTPKSDS